MGAWPGGRWVEGRGADGDAAALHQAWPEVRAHPDRRAVAVCRVTETGRGARLHPARVPSSIRRRAAAAGMSVARRRSGGGAVLVTPEDPVWIDVWVPAGDPLWRDDVGRAFDWLGDAWVAALGRVGDRRGVRPPRRATWPAPGGRRRSASAAWGPARWSPPTGARWWVWPSGGTATAPGSTAPAICAGIRPAWSTCWPCPSRNGKRPPPVSAGRGRGVGPQPAGRSRPDRREDVVAHGGFACR